MSHGAVVLERDLAVRAFGQSRARQVLTAVAAAPPPRPPLPAAAIDEVLLVHGWLQAHREAVNVLDVRVLCEHADAGGEPGGPDGAGDLADDANPVEARANDRVTAVGERPGPSAVSSTGWPPSSSTASGFARHPRPRVREAAAEPPDRPVCEPRGGRGGVGLA